MKAKKIAAYVFASAALLLAVVCLTPPGRLGLQFFGLGIKHGAADNRSGITYATDDVGLRLFRNSNDWTPGDAELIRLVIVASPVVSRRYAFLYMVGYRCGAAGPLFWLALVLIVGLLGLALFYRSRLGRAKQASG